MEGGNGTGFRDPRLLLARLVLTGVGVLLFGGRTLELGLDVSEESLIIKSVKRFVCRLLCLLVATGIMDGVLPRIGFTLTTPAAPNLVPSLCTTGGCRRAISSIEGSDSSDDSAAAAALEAVIAWSEK